MEYAIGFILGMITGMITMLLLLKIWKCIKGIYRQIQDDELMASINGYKKLRRFPK